MFTDAEAAKTLYGTMDAERGLQDAKAKKRPLGWLGLAMLLFFNVSGGPFLSEDAVGAAGPLFAILGVILVMLFYSIPSALLAAELSTAFPQDSGVVAWVTEAFGPKTGFTQGVLFWIQGASQLPAYAIMLLDYLRYAICPSGGGFTSVASCEPLDHHLLPFLPSNGSLAIAMFVLGVSWLNWRGLKLVGSVTIVFVIFILLPFVVMCALGLPRLHPSEWLRDRPFGTHSIADIKWWPLLNTLLWLLNYWDSASTLAGEVDQPEKAIPSALAWAAGVTSANYILPILVCSAALPGQIWATGFWVQAGLELGGHVLQWWILAAGLVSFSGQFLAGQATITYELFGMAELGQMPICFLSCNSNGVPMWPLLLTVLWIALVFAVCGSNLGQAVAIANAVYCLSWLGTCMAFLTLRWQQPTLDRPFRIPLGLVGCTLLLFPATLLSATMVLSPLWTGQWCVAGSVVVAASGLLLHSFLGWCRGYFPDAFGPERKLRTLSRGDDAPVIFLPEPIAS